MSHTLPDRLPFATYKRGTLMLCSLLTDLNQLLTHVLGSLLTP